MSTPTIQAYNEPNNLTNILGPLNVLTDQNEQVGTITTSGNITSGGNLAGGTSIQGAIASSATIPTNSFEKVSVNPAAAVTGVKLQAGVIDGQKVAVVNLASTSGYTVTFAAAGTSNVQGGTGVALPITSVTLFIWDAASALWYVA